MSLQFFSAFGSQSQNAGGVIELDESTAIQGSRRSNGAFDVQLTELMNEASGSGSSTKSTDASSASNRGALVPSADDVEAEAESNIENNSLAALAIPLPLPPSVSSEQHTAAVAPDLHVPSVFSEGTMSIDLAGPTTHRRYEDSVPTGEPTPSEEPHFRAASDTHLSVDDCHPATVGLPSSQNDRLDLVPRAIDSSEIARSSNTFPLLTTPRPTSPTDLDSSELTPRGDAPTFSARSVANTNPLNLTVDADADNATALAPPTLDSRDAGSEDAPPPQGAQDRGQTDVSLPLQGSVASRSRQRNWTVAVPLSISRQSRLMASQGDTRVTEGPFRGAGGLPDLARVPAAYELRHSYAAEARGNSPSSQSLQTLSPESATAPPVLAAADSPPPDPRVLLPTSSPPDRRVAPSIPPRAQWNPVSKFGLVFQGNHPNTTEQPQPPTHNERHPPTPSLITNDGKSVHHGPSAADTQRASSKDSSSVRIPRLRSPSPSRKEHHRYGERHLQGEIQVPTAIDIDIDIDMDAVSRARKSVATFASTSDTMSHAIQTIVGASADNPRRISVSPTTPSEVDEPPNRTLINGLTNNLSAPDPRPPEPQEHHGAPHSPSPEVFSPQRQGSEGSALEIPITDRTQPSSPARETSMDSQAVSSTSEYSAEVREQLETLVDKLRPIPRGGARVEFILPNGGQARLTIHNEGGSYRIELISDDARTRSFLDREAAGLAASLRVDGQRVDIEVRQDFASRPGAPKDHGDGATNSPSDFRDDSGKPKGDPWAERQSSSPKEELPRSSGLTPDEASSASPSAAEPPDNGTEHPERINVVV